MSFELFNDFFLHQKFYTDLCSYFINSILERFRFMICITVIQENHFATQSCCSTGRFLTPGFFAVLTGGDAFLTAKDPGKVTAGLKTGTFSDLIQQQL